MKEEIKDQKILIEIADFCEECPSHENCPEEECILYRIESIITQDKIEGGGSNEEQKRTNRNTKTIKKTNAQT